jgi:hypothetical protein
VVTCRELAEADPGRYLPGLGTALCNFACTRVELGRPADALPSAQEAATILRELAAADPGRCRPALAAAPEKQSGYLFALGRPAKAAKVAGKAAKIRRGTAGDR